MTSSGQRYCVSTGSLCTQIGQLDRLALQFRSDRCLTVLSATRSIYLVEAEKPNNTLMKHFACHQATRESIFGCCGPASERLSSMPAAAWMRRAIEANRNFSVAHFHLAAELALLGELDQARGATRAGLALDPGFTIRRFRAGTATDDPIYLAGRERFYEGLRMAGVPEG